MRTGKKSGFTLLEMLVALIIVAMAMAIVWQSFTVAIKAWRKGGDFLTDMHHGDFVMEQLVESLRSAAYFDGSGDSYGFRLENRAEGRYANDKLSWVKSGKGFMPYRSDFGEGLHRIDLTVEDNDEGDPAVMARIYPHLADEDEDEYYEGETWEVSHVVKGIDCRVYIEEDEDWSEEWENSNSVPALVEITLFMDPLEEGEDPVEVKRAIVIPISRELKSGVIFDEAGKETGADAADAVPADSEAAGGSGASAPRRPAANIAPGNAPDRPTSGPSGTAPPAGGRQP